MGPRYLIVDGHSVIFASPELRKLHQRRSALAREALIKRLRNYQDYTGSKVVVVFDGTGRRVSEISEPRDIQIFYSRRGQTADAIIERLAKKYGERFDLTIVTSDRLERQTVMAYGAACISPKIMDQLLEEAQAAPRRAGDRSFDARR